MVEAAWTTTKEVCERITIPEGLLIAIKHSTSNAQVETPPDMPQDEAESFRNRFGAKEAMSYLFIRGPYVHTVPDWAWDVKKRSLTERYRAKLRDGEFPPDFFFPLGSARAWTNRSRETADSLASALWKAGKGSAPNPGMFYWHYFGLEDVTMPAGDMPGVHHFKWFDNTGHRDVWFKDGVGVVKEAYEHNGTYVDSVTELVSFSKSGEKNNEAVPARIAPRHSF